MSEKDHQEAVHLAAKTVVEDAIFAVYHRYVAAGLEAMEKALARC